MRNARLRVDVVRLHGPADLVDPGRFAQSVVDALAARLRGTAMRASLDRVRIRCGGRGVTPDQLASRLADAILLNAGRCR